MTKDQVLQTLLVVYKESTARTRRVFLIINLASILLLISFFNYKYSWLRHQKSYYEHNLEKPKIEISQDFKEKLVKIFPFKDTSMTEEEFLNSNAEINRFTNLSVTDSLIAEINDNLSYDDSRNLMEETFKSDFSFFNIPIIGVRVYLQDVPLLGGMAISILLTWFLFARKKERQIISQISKEIKNIRSKEVIKFVYFTTVFSSIFKADKSENNLKIHLAKFSQILVLSLFFVPCFILFIIQAHDLWETYFWGTEFQKYCAVDDEVYLIGGELVYYESIFNIPDESIKCNVPTFQYLKALRGKVEGISVMELKIELIILQILGFIVLIFSTLQSYNILNIIKDERQYSSLIAEKYIKSIEKKKNGDTEQSVADNTP